MRAVLVVKSGKELFGGRISKIDLQQKYTKLALAAKAFLATSRGCPWTSSGVG